HPRVYRKFNIGGGIIMLKSILERVFSTRQTRSQRGKLLRRLREAVRLDRTESETRRILKLQMRGLSPEFLNYVP
ncbi:MAG: hypothetical protein IJ520_07915, partial [Synergistaceae bacterium]|nr:hypothetical protein [Synergistaceae bacterium]